MKKNLWIINYHAYLPSHTKWTRHFDLCSNLKDYYNVDIFSSSFIHDTRTQIDLSKKNTKVVVEGITYNIIKNRGYNNNISRIFQYFLFLIQTLFYCKKQKEKPDYIIGSSPDLTNGLCAYILSRIYKCKFILEVRDIWPETWVEMEVMTRKSIIYKIFKRLELFLYKKSDKIISLLPGMADYLVENGISREKVEWISNGVDLEKFDNLLKNETSIIFSSEKINVLYTGAIGAANDLSILVDVAEEFQKDGNLKLFFNIIGAGPEEQKLKKKIEDKKLLNIKMWGKVSKDEIPSILKEADILFFNLKNKNIFKKYGISPNKIFEYLASEKPILFSCDSYNNIVQEANSGESVKISKKENIYISLKKLNDYDEQYLKQLGKNGRDYVEKNFSIKSLAKKLQRMLEEL